MANSTREDLRTEIKSEIQNLKESGESRATRLKEIVKRAVLDAKAELSEGSGDLRTFLKSIVRTVADVAQSRKSDLESDIRASLEGGIEAIGQQRRKAIAELQSNIQQLQTNLDQEEAEFETEVNQVLTDIETDIKTEQPQSQESTNQSITSAIQTLRESEEVRLLQKRYAQLRTQLAILKANLVARYEDQDGNLQDYLDEAKTWYDRARPKAESMAEDAKQRQANFEQSLEEAGRASARKEEEIKKYLRGLWQQAIEAFKS